MLAFYVDSSACKNIPVRPETNFVRPEATRDFILKGTVGARREGGDGKKPSDDDGDSSAADRVVFLDTELWTSAGGLKIDSLQRYI